ncbi:OstA-like protein [Aestuariibaculum sediminum]|uniref:OstA-like protein n=1 Tax=Aestuariibaculum sediminum TaxID=2770637 RepID=UPI001CB6D3AF|nr:OstA-like protein [Aestuariibaculum sediminum]
MLSTFCVTAQDKRQIEIKYSGRLNRDEANFPGATILTRDDSQQVHLYHNGTDLWCDKAIRYGQENFIEAYGNVKMIQGDTINMSAKYIEYSGISELAFASGEVVLKDPNSTISSDTLYFDRINQEAFYKSGGTVVKDTSGTITSKIGRYLMQQKKYRFTENVVLTNDDAIINSDYFDFYSDTGKAFLYGPSTIVTETSKTYCEKGFYDTKNKTGYAVKKSRIDYDNRIIEGDSLYFDNNISFASATNNIKVTDTINKTIVKGHYAEVFKEKDSLFITKRALAATKQENDSIYMHADKIMVTGKPDERILRAYYNAKIFKTDLSGKADSIHSNQKTGVTQLINLNRLASLDKFATKRRPIMWNVESQMTGDTIHLFSNTKTEKLDSLLVFDNAFIISKDTLSEDGYNQINGLKLLGQFDDENQLRTVDINKNAQSIFYVRNDKQELVGIDKAKSGRISILFGNGDIEEYTRFNQVDGTLPPESEYLEKDKRLKGFDWREDERPQSVADLFSEDKPIVLPKIQGLEDYIPEDDFFNEEMMERINMAGNSQEFLGLKNGNNLLEYPNDFENNIWYKQHTKVSAKSTLSPNKKELVYSISGIGQGNGQIIQSINKTHGKFKFSIWLKGSGVVSIIIQRNGAPWTSYESLGIDLPDSWKKYSISTLKPLDQSKLRCLISNIEPTDEVYAWGASLIEIKETPEAKD